jgi:hypothetical protein
MKTQKERIEELEEKLKQISSKLESIVVTDGCDAGCVLLSDDAPTHYVEGIMVYDLDYFSPLGEALMEVYKLCNAK